MQKIKKDDLVVVIAGSYLWACSQRIKRQAVHEDCLPGSRSIIRRVSTVQKIKKDDLVVVIAGKDKDKQGKVLSVDTKKNKVVVEGCNMITKHTKQSPANPQGGIVNQEAPIDISNVMLVVDGKATRVGFEVRDGKKVRVAKKTGKVVD